MRFKRFELDPVEFVNCSQVSLAAMGKKNAVVFFDEVQRVPSILNTVQYLIDKKAGYQFVLTGSSARKLRLC